MLTDEVANELCLKCQLCCRGTICRVIISEAEKTLFPTIDFSNIRQSDGRSYFNQPCPHIDAEGCQIYSNRPKDCSSWDCRLLRKFKKGKVALAAATRTIEELKKDIGKLSGDMREGEHDHRGFRVLHKQWIEKGLHKKNPVLSHRLRSILKQVDKQFSQQSSLNKLTDVAPTDKKRISVEVESKFNAASTARKRLVARRQVVKSILLETEDINTPAYVADDLSLDRIVANARAISDSCGANLLYSVKANAVAAVIERLAPQVDGISCSSLPELQLVRKIAGRTTKLHFVGPGIAEAKADTLFRECERVSFNSIEQWKRFGVVKTEGPGFGLRINPHLSLNNDLRFNPCRPHSKLGVSIYVLKKLWKEKPAFFEGIGGLHVHNATGQTDFKSLAATVNTIKEALPDLLYQMNWINLGGGYNLLHSKNLAMLDTCCQDLKDRFGLAVFIEPGTALVRSGCWLVATVIDLFNSEGRDIAVLDTSINHQLESFIYKFNPSVANASKNGLYRYQLAGASCLAGDLLGHYSFDQPLAIGSRVLFQDVGAYTHAFTIRYNGLSPPDIYQISPDGSLKLRRRFTQSDFALSCGV